MVGSTSFALNHKILQRFPVDKCNCLVHFGGVIYLFPMLDCQVHISSSFKILGMSWRILLYWIFNSLAFSLSIADLIHSWSFFCCFNNSFRNELCICLFCFSFWWNHLFLLLHQWCLHKFFSMKHILSWIGFHLIAAYNFK